MSGKLNGEHSVELHGKTAEAYWERRIVLIEYVLMEVTKKIIDQDPAQAETLGSLMMMWDDAIGQLDAEFMIKDFQNNQP